MWAWSHRFLLSGFYLSWYDIFYCNFMSYVWDIAPAFLLFIDMFYLSFTNFLVSDSYNLLISHESLSFSWFILECVMAESMWSDFWILDSWSDNSRSKLHAWRLWTNRLQRLSILRYCWLSANYLPTAVVFGLFVTPYFYFTQWETFTNSPPPQLRLRPQLLHLFKFISLLLMFAFPKQYIYVYVGRVRIA
jgi:hypothetical protein